MDDRDAAACRRSGGHASVVRLLLGAGADPNNRQQHGYTPLHSAAANGDLESVSALLDAGADPAAANDEGETALILAEKRDDLVIVERLRDALGLTAVSSGTRTPAPRSRTGCRGRT